VLFTKWWSPVMLDQQTETGVNKTPDQHVILVHPQTVDAVSFADNDLPEALEKEEGGRRVGDLEEDVCELRG